MTKLAKYYKQFEETEILNTFNELYKLSYEASKNKEFYELLKQSKIQALEENIKGEALIKFVKPLYEAISNEALMISLVSKEDKALWNNKELKVKREALKGELNYLFKKLIIFARDNNANEKFIDEINSIQKECFKKALDLKEIHVKINELKKQVLEPQNQLNENQKLTKIQFDDLINNLVKECESENIIINQYNSGEYNNIDSSLWSEIFNLKTECINENTPQHIVTLIINDLNTKKDKLIQKILFKRNVKEQKEEIKKQAMEIFLETLSPRQREIREAFNKFQEPLKNKYSKEFWNILKEKRYKAISEEINDNKLQTIFKELEIEALNTKYKRAKENEK